MSPERVLEPFTEAAFRNGFVLGIGALIIGFVVAAAWRTRRAGPCPVAGLLLAAAGAAAIVQAQRPVPGLVPGILALGVGGALVDVVPRLRPLLPLLALPGAWLVATGVEAQQPWLPLVLAAAVAGGGALVADFDARWSAMPIAPGLMVVSLAGVFVTVPETKEALPVVGAALPLALLGWPAKLACLGAGGAMAATGLLAWTVGQGGTFRVTAIVGGLACLGMLVAEPLGRMLRADRSGRRLPRTLGVVVAVAGAHLVVVFVVARVAGVREELPLALGITLVTLAAATGFAVGLRSAVRARSSAI